MFLGLCSVDVEPVWHLYVIVVDHRDALLEHLANNHISAGIHYPSAIPQLGAYNEIAHFCSKCPESIRRAKKMISLPIYPELTLDQQDYIVSKIREFFSKPQTEFPQSVP